MLTLLLLLLLPLLRATSFRNCCGYQFPLGKNSSFDCLCLFFRAIALHVSGTAHR